jgi:hypothetical protein
MGTRYADRQDPPKSEDLGGFFFVRYEESKAPQIGMFLGRGPQNAPMRGADNSRSRDQWRLFPIEQVEKSSGPDKGGPVNAT